MCGRYVSPEEAAVERAWHIGRRNWTAPFGKPRYNVAPTMRVIMLRRDAASPERMPVVLPDEVRPQWLDPAQVDPARATALIEEHAQTDFELVRVGRGINRTEEDSEKLIEPLEVGQGSAVKTAANPEQEQARAHVRYA